MIADWLRRLSDKINESADTVEEIEIKTDNIPQEVRDEFVGKSKALIQLFLMERMDDSLEKLKKSIGPVRYANLSKYDAVVRVEAKLAKFSRMKEAFGSLYHELEVAYKKHNIETNPKPMDMAIVTTSLITNLIQTSIRDSLES